MGMDFPTAQQTKANGTNDNYQRKKKRSPIQTLNDILLIRKPSIDQQIEWHKDDTQYCGKGRHGYTQR
jgi:hypothetical protein